MDSEGRFDRLENKIDKITDAMVKLVEIDTKMIGLVKHNTIQDNRLNRHSLIIDEHSVKIAVTEKASGSNEWFVRVLIASLMSIAGALTGAMFII
jgi:hypothetical protein